MGKALVIGGGPNGLAAAITLAAKGRSVTLLEGTCTLGGRCAVLDDTATVQPWAVEALGLDLEWVDAAPVVHATSTGNHTIDADEPAVAAWLCEVATFTPLIRELSASAPPNIRLGAAWTQLLGSALPMAKLGRAKGFELARIGPLCAEDWLDESGIDRSTQAALIAPALLGTWMGPRSPTSALAVLFHHALSGQEIEGGMDQLLGALVRRANGAGVDIRTEARVVRIIVEEGRAVGVTLDDGAELRADVVLSTIGLKNTMFSLVGHRALPFGLDMAVENIRSRGVVAQWRATAASPLFGGAERVVVVDDTTALERAFDDAKHRRLPSRPAMLIRQRGETLNALVFGAAHDLDGGWSDEARISLQKTILDTLGERADASLISNAELITPVDLESTYGLEGGHLFHGEFALDQFLSFRPHPMLSGYKSGIDGLWLGGAGMHPAGGFTLGQGILAAGQV
jgi:phytoene dehydrogenase-like protein